MGTLKPILFAAAILTSGVVFTASGHAGDNGMRQACNENQRAGVERQKCYDRYGLGTAPIFRDETRRYRANNRWYEPERPRRYRQYDGHKQQYIYADEFALNHDGIGLVIQLGDLSIFLK